ncbi:MarR family transcriptional regulator [Streptomyces triticagri]|uniref:MarR family transcriptional regulator n=1 Tax=Streptomyces triticagri TaxID=2293568 RepID=A0A372M850_9ACTN|nr:MarR family transcriptional regulator [Streptomyces triticagri]RFU87122.1 MarR family transcriptional regulator [Streptomyces triticagri]
MTSDSGRREKAIEELTAAGRESSTVSVMFHTAVASLQGLGASETKTLELLERLGALTAKELAERTGLRPASVTGLVDRLEAKGYVRRVKHPTDKRRVLIEFRPEKLAEVAPLFDDWAREVHALYEEFSTEELETITRFLRGSTARQREAAARLSEAAEGGAETGRG